MNKINAHVHVLTALRGKLLGIKGRVATVSRGYARDTVADFGLHGVYNSGRELVDYVTVDAFTARQCRKVLAA